MRDYRVWWGLFVIFAVLSVLAVQHGYRRWRRIRGALVRVGQPDAVHERHVRREAWRLGWMVVSVVTMTTLVFAALLGAPAWLLVALRVVAVAGVAGVLVLSLVR